MLFIMDVKENETIKIGVERVIPYSSFTLAKIDKETLFHSNNFDSLFKKIKFNKILYRTFVVLGLIVFFLSYFIFMKANIYLFKMGTIGSSIIMSLPFFLLGIISFLVRPKLPNELSYEEELGLQHYLKQKRSDFVVEKTTVCGTVNYYKEENGCVTLGFVWDHGLEDQLQLPKGINSIKDDVVGMESKRRVVILDYPGIGKVVASDKLMLYEAGLDSSKLNRKNLKVLIKKIPTEKDNYSVIVNY